MSNNQLEHFREVVGQGRVAYGCCITFHDPAITEIAAEAGFDFCWIDGEHGVLDRFASMIHIMALKGTRCAPFFRVASCDHTEIKKVIDFAPAGVIVPMVMDAADAERAVAACRYPPRGNRGCGFRRGNRYGSTPLAQYLKDSATDPLVILQIEHIDAARNLDAILAVPGVDAILIGPYDLSCSLGKTARWDDPEVVRVLDDVCRRTRRAGKLLGAYAESDHERWLERGVQFLSVASDMGALRHAFETLLAAARPDAVLAM